MFSVWKRRAVWCLLFVCWHSVLMAMYGLREMCNFSASFHCNRHTFTFSYGVHVHVHICLVKVILLNNWYSFLFYNSVVFVVSDCSKSLWIMIKLLTRYCQ